MAWADTGAMRAHLEEIGASVAPGARAVLVLDQAGRHMSGALAVPGNITLLPPPRSPELNPAENAWQFLRGSHLSNRVFAACEDIVARCRDAWNTPMDQPWRIRSIGLRDRAHGFRSVQVGISSLSKRFQMVAAMTWWSRGGSNP